jgi:hypothetical protein
MSGRRRFCSMARALALCASFFGAASPSLAADVKFWTVTEPVAPHATFNSNNTKFLPFGKGAIISYVTSKTKGTESNRYQISYLDPERETETVLVTGQSATNAPCLVELSDKRVAAFVNDHENREIALFIYQIFAAPISAALERQTNFKGGVFGKYACASMGTKLYFIGNDGRLRSFSSQGELLWEKAVFQRKGWGGISAQYPQLYIADGEMHLALTTARKIEGNRNRYWSILYFLSPDGGATWQDRFGRNLELPLNIDFDQPIGVTAPNELKDNTWLSGFVVQRQRVTFAYTTNGDPNLPEGKERHPLEPVFRGARLDRPEHRDSAPALLKLPESFKSQIQSGFFSMQAADSQIAYFTTFIRSEIIVLKTTDGGAAWNIHVRAPSPAKCAYAVDGLRQVNEDNRIVGMVTDRGVGCLSRQPYETAARLLAFEIQL